MRERGDGNIWATRHELNTSALIVMMQVQLPVRKEITLSEAVTAFVYGKPRDPSSGPLYPSYASDVLLEQLHRAARAGQVRFHALKIGKNKYQEIKPSYFRKRCHFKQVVRKTQLKSSDIPSQRSGALPRQERDVWKCAVPAHQFRRSRFFRGRIRATH